MAGHGHKHVVIRRDGAAGLVLLDRVDRANAYTDAMLADLALVLDELAADEAVRVVVVGSAVPGRFCSGADLDEIRKRSTADAGVLKSLALFDRIEELPKPTIAAIGGAAYGGGLELALACDLRIAAPEARFAMPETARGILPGAGGTWRLPRTVGPAMAREMILFGRVLDGDAALACGLVSELVAPDRLLGRAVELAAQVVSRDFLATSLAKEALRKAASADGGREFVARAQATLYGCPGKGDLR
jgi:enoyl-CoA hydratase